MNWVLILVAILIYLGIIGLSINVKLNFNFKENDGDLIIKIFKIPIIKLNLKIEGNAINFTKDKIKKNKTKSFIINIQNLQFVKELKKNIAKRIYITKFNIDCFVILNNPALSTLLSSAIANFLAYIKYRLFLFQNDLNVKTNVVTGFQDNEVAINIDFSVVISITDLIWAFIVTIFKRKHENGKKHRQLNM